MTDDRPGADDGDGAGGTDGPGRGETGGADGPNGDGPAGDGPAGTDGAGTDGKGTDAVAGPGSRTRRAVLAAALAGGVAGAALSPAGSLLDRFAPGSGRVWDTAGDTVPGTVESPHGPATVRYDEYGVPHVEADSERALTFAVGYVQAADRLFQMDLGRRQMRGELAAVFGERALPSDRFYAHMDFVRAAEATWDRVDGTDAGAAVSAFASGVNRYRSTGRLPQEFDLLGYEPDPWRGADTMLAEKQIGWGLTGSFRALRRETLAAALGADAARTLMPDRLDHDATILGHEGAGARLGADGVDASGVDASGAGSGSNAAAGAGPGNSPRTGSSVGRVASAGPESGVGRGASVGPGSGTDPGSGAGPTRGALPEDPRPTHPSLGARLSRFEPPSYAGSNSWVIGGEHTASGRPLLANDPHLTLTVPPVWYEMHLSAPDLDVRGVAFPGVPFVVIGENDAGAWGFTNANSDVIDLYEYETRGGEYRYGEEFRAFETDTHTIAVSDGPDREIERRRTVHGPVLSADAGGTEFRTEVGVAWTGFGATRTVEAVRAMNYSDGLGEFREALRRFDLPTQNCVYADGTDTLYRSVGKVPIRRTDGEAVAGDRVFDGSAREGEWPGYTPYGAVDWEGDGFIPFGEMPAVENPGYLGTANQRIVDDEEFPYYFAESYADPFRGIRLWDRLDARVAGPDPADPEFVRDVQLDTYDERGARFVPTLLEERGEIEAAAARGGDGPDGGDGTGDGEGTSDGDAGGGNGSGGEGTDAGAESGGGDAPTVASLLDELADWDYRMDRDSRGALVFARFLKRYREVVFRPRLEAALPEARDPATFYGSDWVLIGLDPDSAWFPEGRPAKVARALSAAAEELAEEGWETYGDYNRTAIDHPFGRSWLNYPRYPTDGSPATLRNFRKEQGAGSSWRQANLPGREGSAAVLPGGNDGSPFSEHYGDQLRPWADGEYKPLSFPTGADAGPVAVRFRGAGGDETEGGDG